MERLKVTVSGSFTRHIDEIQDAVRALQGLGAEILSPAQPYVVDSVDGFVFVASDRHRSVRLVQDRHLAAIASSDFLWLVSPDGYVGQSAALELGFAIGLGIPILSTANPLDLTLRQYVRRVDGVEAAIGMIRHSANDELTSTLLIDPESATANAAIATDKLRRLLTSNRRLAESKNLPRQVALQKAAIDRVLWTPGQAKAGKRGVREA